MKSFLFLSCIALAVTGCKSPSKPAGQTGGTGATAPAPTAPTAPGAAAAPAAPAPAAPAPAAPTEQAWAKRPTADCPAYPGKASVTLANVDGGYTATITTTDSSAVDTIRAHAAYVVDASKAGAGADALQFGGATGDRTRNCPVILAGTTITSENIDGGARLTVLATAGTEVAALRTDAKDRAELLAIMRDAMK